MKQLATTLLFGKDARLSGIIALLIVAAIALGCTCGKNFGDLGNLSSNSNSTTSSNTATEPPDAGGIPSDTTLQAMIKETTADFAQAVDTNDFHDIYEKSSSDFQTTYTEEQMQKAFKLYVDNKKRVLPSINKVPGSKGEFSPAPSIRTEKGLEILVLNGKFPTKPLAVKFEYEYVKRGGQWKLLKLIINM
jgi:hypothetical protein